MKHKAIRGYLNDLTGPGSRNRRFEHGFVHGGVELVPDDRRNELNSVLPKDRNELAHGQLDTLDYSLVGFPMLLRDGFDGTLHIVEYRKQVARKAPKAAVAAE